MGKVVINNCYGGFSISEEARNWLEDHGLKVESVYYIDSRHHPLLIQCVEELGEKASGIFADLIIKEFEGDLYRIEEYDGAEQVETPNSIEWINVNDTSASW